MTKQCSKCKQEKTHASFYSRCDGAGKTGLKSRCKDCLKEQARSPATREYARNYGRVYNSTDHRRAYGAAWRRDWRKTEAARVYRRQYEANRIKNDVHFRLCKRMSSLINRSLSRLDLTKGSQSWRDLVGYSELELKSHLEALFDQHMSWANYGTYWHIDHIIPKSLFVFTSNQDASFRQCWALANLRPLEAVQNIRRNRKEYRGLTEVIV